MKTAHTPAPWTVHLTGYTGRASAKYVINDVKRRAVAHIKHSTISPMKANAQLIAAAPELLEALQDMLDYYGSASANVEALTKARAAIAKATGETL